MTTVRAKGWMSALFMATMVAAQGQSFNLDLDVAAGGAETGAGAPSSAFGGAALQPGYWQAVTANGPGPYNLMGLDGLQTGCMLSVSGGWGVSGGYNNPILSGDVRALMADYADVLGANYEIAYHFSGFQAGLYTLTTYACAPYPNDPVDMTITVAGAVNPVQHVTGPIPGNFFVEGVTHSRHQLFLAGSSFDIDVRRTVPGPPNDSVCNGFQITWQPVPEPTSLSACIAALCGLARRRRRRL